MEDSTLLSSRRLNLINEILISLKKRTHSIANIVETSIVNSQKSINNLGANTPPTSLSDIQRTNTNKTVMAKGDSGASDNYWSEEDAHVLIDIRETLTPPITLPNKESLIGKKVGTLPLHEKLTKKAKDATILPGLKSASLISLGKLCDDGCNIALHEDKLYIYKDNELVLTGYRNRTDNLWDIPVQKTKINYDNCKFTTQHAGLYHNTTKRHQTEKIQSSQKILINPAVMMKLLSLPTPHLAKNGSRHMK